MGRRGFCDSELPTLAKEEVCSQLAAQVPWGAEPPGGGLGGGVGGWEQGLQLQPAAPGGWEMPESSTAQCEQGAGRGFLPAEQGIVPKKDSLPKGDRAQPLEVGAQYGTSRSSSHGSYSFTFDP